jgi:hypothetical protein
MAKQRKTADPVEPGFDEFGQPVGAVKGDPVPLPPLANNVPKDENPMEAIAPVEEESIATDPTVKAELLKLLQDPDIATQVVEAAAQTPEGRKALNIPTGQGAPQGAWERNYLGEQALRVYGGVEVAHPAGYVPNPPSYIPKYVAQDGGTTDHVDGWQDREGNTHRGALKDAHGQPVKTDMFKYWLDKRVTGDRLEGEVQSDIAAGAFQVNGRTGVPEFQDDDGGINPES